MTRRMECPLSHNARTLGDHPAIIRNHQITIYRQLEDKVCSAVECLKDCGVKPRERVAVISPNSVEYIITLFALWRHRAVACLVSTRLPEEGVRSCLQNISCVRTLAPEAVQGTCISGKVRVPGNAGYTFDQEMTIMFTSGSAGEPKAAVHTFGNHYYSAKGANEHLAVGPTDRWLLSLPLYHVGGLGVVFRAFLTGAAVVICESKDIIEAIWEDHATHVSLVPAQLYRLLETAEGVEALKKLKVILLGGSAAAESLVRRALSHHLAVYVTYGLTEMSSQVATSRCLMDGDLSLRAQILNDREVRIAPDGEVMVKGKTLFKGYVSGKGIDPSVDQNGWFSTGDLGRLHEDGTLSITGRKDRMFVSGGENIHPEEIERCLCQMESIAQAVVVGIAHMEFGCRPVAFVSSTEGVRITRAEILDHLRHHLPKFKIPDQIYHWPKDVDEKGTKVDWRYFSQLAGQSGTNLIPVN